MILLQTRREMWQFGQRLTITAFALTLVACAPMEEVDNTTGSRLAQPPAGTPPQKPTEAGDIAIVGQEVAHAIMDLPVVADATVPPLVQFTGVTSIVDKPIDTDPYTELLRDRLLLLTREKLRFVERTLPPLVLSKKGKKKVTSSQPVQNTEDPDYQILAELRGHAEDDSYRIQVEFVDIHTNDVLFNGLYRIRAESSEQPPPDSAGNNEPPPPAPEPDLTTPATTRPAPSGNQSL